MPGVAFLRLVYIARMNFAALVTAVGLLSMVQTSGPTTRPDGKPTLEDARQEAMEVARAATEGYQGAEPIELDDLVEHEFENEYLILTLGPERGPGRWLQPVTDQPEKVVSLWVMGPRGADPDARAVTVNIAGAGEGPADVVVQTSAVFGILFGSVQLAQDSSFLLEDGREGIRNVSVIQLSSAGTAEDAGVRLRVSGDDRQTGEWVSLVWEADTFAALMREEPVAFQQYVAPMLDELGLGEIVDDQTRAAAQQLLLEGVAVPPEVEREVADLLVSLDADDAATRDAAEEALKDLGMPAATAVTRLLADEEAREKLSAEQALRLRNVLADFRPLSPEALEALASDSRFWRRVERLEGEQGDQLLAEMAATRPATRPSTLPVTGQSR